VVTAKPIQVANKAKKRLIGNKKLVAPIVSQLVEKLQTSGILRFHCAVFQCIGYNHAVCQGIIEHSGPFTPIPGSSNNSEGNKGSASLIRLKSWLIVNLYCRKTNQ
jgi:hypothetical protein